MTMTWKNIEASGMSEKDKQYMVMYGIPKEWLDELITDWQEPLMGGLTMLAMSVLSDAQERIALGHDDIARQYINRAKYVIKQMEQVK
jgi:hypothetical protein